MGLGRNKQRKWRENGVGGGSRFSSMIGNLLPIVLAGGDARAIVAGKLNLMNDRDEHALPF